MMNNSTTDDPFKVLGVPQDASEDEIRARYLDLVKRYPPDREPEKFRQVQTAFQLAKDPLLIARRLLVAPSDKAAPWSDALEEQKRHPPALDPMLLLSLGNRDASYGQGEGESGDLGSDQKIQDDPHQKQHFVEQPHE